jgi:hypothetical protein
LHRVTDEAPNLPAGERLQMGAGMHGVAVGLPHGGPEVVAKLFNAWTFDSLLVT